jgi:hypothetical protein
VPKLKRSRKSHTFIQTHRLWLIGLFVAIILGTPVLTTHAATLSSASLAVGDPRPSATSAYTFTGSSVSLSLIRCIKMVYADTSTGTNVPTNMITNTGGVTLDTANTNYIPTPGSWTLNKPANGTLTLTNGTGETPASATGRKVAINGITNSSTADTAFFYRFSTFTNVDCATGPIDNVTVQFILTNGSTLTLNVDQTLSFTVNAVAAGQQCNGAGSTSTATSTATTIPFGTVSAASNAIVCQDLQAATNATNGYTISARYTAKPTNALAQTIADFTAPATAPTAFSAAGTEAYGYTTNDATLSNIGNGVGRFATNKWAAMTTTNAEVGYETAGVTSTTYRVGHQVGVGLTTRPGTYTTTIIYTCTPVY